MIATRRYESEPRKRRAYLEACDMICVYGIERNMWNYLKLGINRVEMKEIWGYAVKDMNGESPMDVIVDYVPARRRVR